MGDINIMFGSFIGNVSGIAYFLVFQFFGIVLAFRIFHKESTAVTVLLGSVIGSFSLQWLPVLFAFFLNFSKTAHVAALITMFLLVAAACHFLPVPATKEKTSQKRKITWNIKEIIMDNPVLFILVPLFLFTVVVLCQKTIADVDGAMHSGQSTYGDMNMHLGFITSIANQQTFPPEYSILPGTKLAYPFLSDSISSSVYLWGASLRTAYLLPMFFALIQVFAGMYILSKHLLCQIGTSYRAKSFLAFVLFFFNGGLGFLYFLPGGQDNENFTRIFTAFYETPTNYVSENIQWHNIICDMLIPQRATLFGWAILFPVLYLIQKGRKTKEKSYFIVSGILAGGLVLIHTHSFLALGILCAVFLLQDLVQNTFTETKTWMRLTAVLLFLVAMEIIRSNQCGDDPWQAGTLLALGLIPIIVLIGMLVFYLKKSFSKETLLTWGIFLGIVVVLALPQLFGFTFRQAQGDQFVRGSFNWANSTDIGDGYSLFYLKNLGIMFIVPLLILVFGTKKQRQLIAGASFLWVICEFILFQPNPYDNNKLLLVAYMFFCIAGADFIWENIPVIFQASLQKRARAITVAIAVFVASIGAVLTMGREYVADYELYSSSYVELAEWIEENTDPTDIFLTATNHNNAVASLTGRNIVCGSSTFLYYHGVNYQQAEADVSEMYQTPDSRDALLQQYNVSYIVIGSVEQSTYSIPDLDEWISKSNVVYNKDGVLVLAV
jgi:hypothetical protein